MKKRICVVTGSRAEYGVLYHTIKGIKASRDLELQLVVTGMHLSKEFGYTVQEIENDGFAIADRVDNLLSADSSIGIAKSVGLGILGFTDCFRRLDPDILLIVGDRFEIFAAASAAMPMNIPIAHISGGELTAGAIDEQIRHAITKMSHLHFVAVEENAARVRQMGEEPWRIHTVGGPWVDNIRTIKKLSRKALRKSLGICLTGPTILVTYHPETLQSVKTSSHIRNLLDALDRFDAEIIFTYPNADTGGRVIISAIEGFTASRRNAKAFKSLGSLRYLSLLSHVDLLVGNSSSGMVETQSFKLPTVNIGKRQEGRLVTENIICTGRSCNAIAAAIEKGLSSSFRRSIAGMVNPYGRDGAAKNIVRVLTEVRLGSRLLKKRFISSSKSE